MSMVDIWVLLLQNRWVQVAIALLVLEEVIRRLKPKLKGTSGEAMVSMILSRLPKDQYTVLHNVMLRTDRGTSQVDHIVTSVYGIFVIEVKNYTGWITGSENSSQWTQTIYKTKNRFMNPIHQNYGHVKAIEALIRDPTVPIYPIVAFAGDAKLKISAQKANVVKLGALNDTIRSLSSVKVMDEYRMRELASMLQESNIDSRENRKAHVAEINHMKALIRSGICPRCGGQLVERNGKYGKFIGCSNYPKCRYTQKRELS